MSKLFTMKLNEEERKTLVVAAEGLPLATYIKGKVLIPTVQLSPFLLGLIEKAGGDEKFVSLLMEKAGSVKSDEILRFLSSYDVVPTDLPEWG